MVRLGRGGEAKGLIVARDLDKKYVRGSEEIHVLQGLNLDVDAGEYVAFVLPVNGLTTGTMNWQTYSHMAFAFRVTPGLLATGVVFALLMGLVGGVPPAVRAARMPVAAALRDL